MQQWLPTREHEDIFETSRRCASLVRAQEQEQIFVEGFSDAKLDTWQYPSKFSKKVTRRVVHCLTKHERLHPWLSRLHIAQRGKIIRSRSKKVTSMNFV